MKLRTLAFSLIVFASISTFLAEAACKCSPCRCIDCKCEKK